MDLFIFKFEDVHHIVLGGLKGGGFALAFSMINGNELIVEGAAATPVYQAWLAYSTPVVPPVV